MNRERTNVGRSAYSDRVRAILLNVKSDRVIDEFTQNLVNMSSGKQCDEMKWVDVQTYAVQLLNARKETVFVTPEEIKSTGGSILEVVQNSGKTPVFVPETVKKKLENVNDTNGNRISTIETVVQQYNDSFEYKFVPYENLTLEEKKIYDLIPSVLTLLGAKITADRIYISEVLKKDISEPTLGVFERAEYRIIILRKQLSSRKDFLGTLIHEIAHADSGCADISRGFETELTMIIGKLADEIFTQKQSLDASKKNYIISRSASTEEHPPLDKSKLPQMSSNNLVELGKSVETADGILVYQELLRRIPNSVDYLYELAVRYRIIDDYSSAHNELDKALKIDYENGKLHTEKAANYYYEGNLLAALNEIEIARYYGYISSDLYLLEGVSNYERGNIQKAIICLEEGMHRLPTNEDIAHNLLSIMIGVEKNYIKAIAIAEFAIEHQPEKSVFYFLKAISLVKEFRYEEAYLAAKSATELEPGEAKYQQLLGFAGSMREGGMSWKL